MLLFFAFIVMFAFIIETAFGKSLVKHGAKREGENSCSLVLCPGFKVAYETRSMRSSRFAALTVNNTSPFTSGTSGQRSAEWVSNSAVLEPQDRRTKPPLSLLAFSVSSIVRLPSKQRQARSTFLVREKTKEKLSPLAGISVMI